MISLVQELQELRGLRACGGGLAKLYRCDQYPFQGSCLGAEHETSTPLGTLVSL